MPHPQPSARRFLPLLALSALLLGGPLPSSSTLAQMSSAASTFPGDPRPDAPELSARGPHAVGVRTLKLVNKNQLDIAAAKSPLTRYDRPLTVEVWYPATLKAGEAQVTSYADVLGSGPGDQSRPLIPFQTPGRAARDAAPEAGTYPLVIVSHGYPGSRYLLSYLCENLASKGYVVAAIDHTDSTHADKAVFASTLLNRPLDDAFVLDSLATLGAAGSGSVFSGHLDPNRAALVGYSMGGYGALNLVGAGFAKQVMGFVPGGALAARATGAYRVDPRIKAVVAFAPWGGDDAVRAIGVPGAAQFGFWDAAGLAGVRVPTLFVVGDHDDVAGYVGGVKELFENTVHSDRYMLVYQNALHNVAPNPPPGASLKYPDEYAHYAEPAWDSQRLNNLNEHFVTAFLNYRLKGQQDAAAYLDVPSVKADQGTGGSGWKGFPARSAVGLELYHLKAR
ncbi:alpha/beta hydrolase family protein [Deinococcus sp.]|uniref:alpha/beta hydrolase family protein n=1 Tax=Deinococcus sp. TaxID=47478 RepID=UPI003CC55FC5